MLHQTTGGDPRRSARYRDIVSPLFGAVHELRGVVRSGASVLGTYALYREAGVPFSSSDLKRLRDLQRPLRAGLQRAASASRASADFPFGVLILTEAGALRTATARLAEYLESSSVLDELRDVLVSAAASVSRVGAQRLTCRLAEQWISIDAEMLHSGEISVAFRPATPPEVLESQAVARGLTARELQAVRMLMRGYSTSVMAKQLFVSPHTVQGYFTSIFEKLDVHSRRQLAALFSEADAA